MTASQEHHMCLLQHKSNISKESSAVAMEKKKSFDLRALNINYATSYQKDGYLQNHTDEESLKKDWIASLRSDFHLFSTKELLRNLHIYF